MRVFELAGFVFDRQSGSHYLMKKDGVLRPICIPKYDEIGPDIILSNLRTAGISRDQYLELLGRV